jgi:hypothetical protein
MSASDNFYLNQPEPNRSCLLALKEIILRQDKNITTAWKYGMPFFCYTNSSGKNKMFCYLWVHKKLNQPYIGIVEGKHFDHPTLLQEGRSRMKIMLFDPEEDLPVKIIEQIIKQAVELYTSGKIKI